MGTITFTKSDTVTSGPFQGKYGETNFGKYRAVRGVVTFGGTYATGGDSLALPQTSLTQVVGLLQDASRATQAPNRSGLTFELGGTTLAPLILAFDTDNTQVGNGTNLTARTGTPVILLGYK